MHINIVSTENFFARGKTLAILADQGLLKSESQMVSFESSKDLARVVSATRIDLFRSIRHQAGSVTSIAHRLKRDRSAVRRDIAVLRSIGVVEMRTVKNEIHGTKEEVFACVQQVLISW